jgi:hypothetical protein
MGAPCTTQGYPVVTENFPLQEESAICEIGNKGFQENWCFSAERFKCNFPSFAYSVVVGK